MAAELLDRRVERREFLGWLCKVGGGCTAVTLGGGMVPLKRINTVLLREARANGCDEDYCVTADSGGACTVRDVCDEDSSLECTNDECSIDQSGACVGDMCESDKSGGCVGDTCTSDSSGACEGDSCVSDKSGSC